MGTLFPFPMQYENLRPISLPPSVKTWHVSTILVTHFYPFPFFQHCSHTLTCDFPGTALFTKQQALQYIYGSPNLPQVWPLQYLSLRSAPGGGLIPHWMQNRVCRLLPSVFHGPLRDASANFPATRRRTHTTQVKIFSFLEASDCSRYRRASTVS
jgi:hypothetical protein